MTTREDLEKVQARINSRAGILAPQGWAQDSNGKWVTVIGYFELDKNAAGWALERYTNRSGSTTQVIVGRSSAKEMLLRLNAFYEGMCWDDRKVRTEDDFS